MDILALKPYHDGSIAYISDGRLEFLYEGEKNSFARHERLTQSILINALSTVPKIPDVIAASGWESSDPFEAPYVGLEDDTIITRHIPIFGKEVRYFSSSHERSHIFLSYGLSPFEQGEPCYVLLWEGGIGKFYEIDSHLNIKPFDTVITQPGYRYSFMYHIAHTGDPSMFELAAAGKVMALASYSSRTAPTTDEQDFINLLFEQVQWSTTFKEQFHASPYFNIGVESHAFKEVAGKFSDILFDTFYQFAEKNLNKRLPLLIAGGCGLNCEWNSKWKSCGLFPSVFVPPNTNDIGCSLGTAIDAQFCYTGNAKLHWDVYCGETFFHDPIDTDNFEVMDLNYDQVAALLRDGFILGWVQGRYECGPRALGNRSILAAPFVQDIHTRLNNIKQRESYRPIAPVCLEEDVHLHFDWEGPSPHMLYFQKVTDDRLPAVTHVDGSARVQTVNATQNPELHRLLGAFKQTTGVGVLCNTSLNFKGKGFINRLSDLAKYQQTHGLNGFVVENKLYMPRR